MLYFCGGSQGLSGSRGLNTFHVVVVFFFVPHNPTFLLKILEFLRRIQEFH